MNHPLRTLVAASLVLATGSAACSPLARVTKQDGSYVTGEIKPGTPESVQVEVAIGGGERYEIIAVPREAVADIDHPGNVAAVAGLMTAGGGAILVFDSFTPCEGFSCFGRKSELVIGGVVTGLGVALALSGYWLWTSSIDKAASTEIPASEAVE